MTLNSEVSTQRLPGQPPAPSASIGQGGAADAQAQAALPERYEDALAELERIVASMESGQLPLDTLLSSHQRGTALLEHCRQRLQAVEQQVRVLEDNQLKPWTGSGP